MPGTPKLTPEDINLLIRIVDSRLKNPAARDQFKEEELRKLKDKLVVMVSPTLGSHDPEDFEPT